MQSVDALCVCVCVSVIVRGGVSWEGGVGGREKEKRERTPSARH